MTTLAPSVAGHFYPADPDELRTAVREFIGERTPRSVHALIAPHAGYLYSGPIAGSAYRLLDGRARRVLLLGPAHFFPLRGIATHSATGFCTPLGIVPTLGCDRFPVLDEAFECEHSLEVHLPFLQASLPAFTVVPLLVGESTAADVADAIESEIVGEDTLIVVSSDLSHYLDYERAQARDARTAGLIEALQPERIGPADACGCRAVAGLLEVARRRGWRADTLDLRNSGDTSGDKRRVVGYGAFAFA